MTDYDVKGENHHQAQIGADGWVSNIAVMIGGVALITLAAKTQIPAWPVPMTLHTLAVMAFAICLGPKMATSIFLAYLAAGATGLPVFSGTSERGIGLAYMVGPTGGYLAGYLVASWLTGAIGFGGDLLRRLCAMLAGLAVIYGIGIGWLALFVPTTQLMTIGVTPFLLGDLLKVAIITVSAPVLVQGFTMLKGKIR